MTDEALTPAAGQVWVSRYSTATHVAIDATEGPRVHLLPVRIDADGHVAAQPGRGRWSSARQLADAYRPTGHRFDAP